MAKQNEMEQVKKLIDNGFDDIELISFELGIPIEQLQEIQKELEKQKKVDDTEPHSPKKTYKKNTKKTFSKMDQMRSRYNELYFGVKQSKRSSQQGVLSEQEIELINSVIAKLKATIESMIGTPEKERIKTAISILSEIKKIQDYQLTIEELEELCSILMSKELDDIPSSSRYPIQHYINAKRNEVITKLCNAIDIAQAQTDNIEELKALAEKVTLQMKQQSHIITGGVILRIGNKISRIRQSAVIKEIKNDVPTNILEIVLDIVNGTINPDTANATIDEEIKRRLEANKEKGPFGLTESQIRHQILGQIKTEISTKPDQYYLQNPEVVLLQLSKICGGNLLQSADVVVRNLIGRKDFDMAKRVCDMFSTTKEKGKFLGDTINLRRKIRNAQISDLVLKGLAMNGTSNEDKKYYKLIKKGIEQANINLQAISLGTSQNGLREITLADIWEEKDSKQRNF